jgi:hypothetical protein
MLSRKLVLLGILVTATLGLAAAGCGSNSSSIIAPVVDEQPLPAPEAITATVDVTTGGVSLSWLPLASASVAGYNVYAYAPSITRETAYVKVNSTLLVRPVLEGLQYVDGGDFIVKAVSSTGKEGVASHFVHLNPYTGPPEIPTHH